MTNVLVQLGAMTWRAVFSGTGSVVNGDSHIVIKPVSDGLAGG